MCSTVRVRVCRLAECDQEVCERVCCARPLMRRGAAVRVGAVVALCVSGRGAAVRVGAVVALPCPTVYVRGATMHVRARARVCVVVVVGGGGCGGEPRACVCAHINERACVSAHARRHALEVKREAT